MKNIFRKIIVGVGALYIAFMALPFFWLDIYDQETLNALTWLGNGGVLNIYGPLPYLLAIVFIVSLIGMYRLKKWARTLFMLFTIISGLISPLWGLSVAGNIDVLAPYFISIGSGALLAIAYFTSLGAEFE